VISRKEIFILLLQKDIFCISMKNFIDVRTPQKPVSEATELVGGR